MVCAARSPPCVSVAIHSSAGCSCVSAFQRRIHTGVALRFLVTALLSTVCRRANCRRAGIHHAAGQTSHQKTVPRVRVSRTFLERPFVLLVQLPDIAACDLAHILLCTFTQCISQPPGGFLPHIALDEAVNAFLHRVAHGKTVILAHAGYAVEHLFGRDLYRTAQSAGGGSCQGVRACVSRLLGRTTGRACVQCAPSHRRASRCVCHNVGHHTGHTAHHVARHLYSAGLVAFLLVVSCQFSYILQAFSSEQIRTAHRFISPDRFPLLCRTAHPLRGIRSRFQNSLFFIIRQLRPRFQARSLGCRAHQALLLLVPGAVLFSGPVRFRLQS